MAQGNSEHVNVTLVVACALVDADKRVLIAQRPEGKALAGLWEFPGGKLDPGERPEQALIRELREEIGIEVAEPSQQQINQMRDQRNVRRRHRVVA